MSPNITVMAAYNRYNKLPIGSSVKFDDEIIAWAAHENSKNRFKTNLSLWTIQCTEFFSKKIINLSKKDKDKYQSIILKKFENLLGYQIKKIVFKSIHGWKYSYNKTKTPFSGVRLESHKENLGVFVLIGLIGPKAEDSLATVLDRFISKR